MDSIDLSVLKVLHEWLTKRHAVWLVTVIGTYGSSPRPEGSMLIIRSDGQLVGSVSGGCIEDDLIYRAVNGYFPPDKVDVLSYGETSEEASRFRLPCGGAIRLLVEPVINREWVTSLLELIGSHRLVKRILDLSSNQIELLDAGPEDTLSYDGKKLVTIHGPRWRLLIIGAGQTSYFLAKMAQALDYLVFVCDPREEFRQTWDLKDTVLMSEMPDDAVQAIQIDACTAVIALTHDAKLDDMALLEALKSPAFYVGALGSSLNNKRRRERLAMFDLSPDEIGRLHGPVGLDIGSRTPPEIAVSILAHLISTRNLARRVDVSNTYQEFCL